MATKKDFSKVGTGRTYKTMNGQTVKINLQQPDEAAGTSKVYDSIATATTKKGQHTNASPEEQAERAEAMRTQGRKGCKAIRINMAFTPENHQFIKLMAKATGRTMTEYCNMIVKAYRKEHPEFEEEANRFLKLANAAAWSETADDPAE